MTKRFHGPSVIGAKMKIGPARRSGARPPGCDHARSAGSAASDAARAGSSEAGTTG